ncbi:Esterase OS=Streptomyces aurantiogriseus OX=66870 GN=GCM10010251_66560 PE=4 SV=1 [Streptomyces aurantiogriseus]|uniref:Esterase n=1 Tax=Streptomyces aurantiogriseus TaxID=66870 RepID=A0A918FIW0_9ACTN|nr:hypothetical protein GCM10010251_66560 [Streptomyces aurantiogriseus]
MGGFIGAHGNGADLREVIGGSERCLYAGEPAAVPEEDAWVDPGPYPGGGAASEGAHPPHVAVAQVPQVMPSRFSSGYMLPTETNPMIGPNSFGHTGRGGSLGFADPEHGIAFGYVMNNIIGGPNDMRATSLVDAVRRSLA